MTISVDPEEGCCRIEHTDRDTEEHDRNENVEDEKRMTTHLSKLTPANRRKEQDKSDRILAGHNVLIPARRVSDANAAGGNIWD